MRRFATRKRHWSLGAALMVGCMIAACQQEIITPPADTEPPELIAVFPADRTTAVPVESTMYARFSEPLRPESISARPLRLVGPDGQITGVAALSPDATMMTLTPQLPLPAFADFNLIVPAGIADLAGNPSPDSVSVTFSTAADFLDVGRFFISNEASENLTVLGLDYLEVPGSPVQLGVAPLRMRASPAEQAVYVLYENRSGGTAGGVLVVDGRTLTIRRDSGAILPPGLTDLALDEDGRLFIAAPGVVLVLDAVTFTEAAGPIGLGPEDASPVRLEVSTQLDRLFVGDDSQATLDAFELPSLERRPGFPVLTQNEIRGIIVEPERLRVWVGGFNRYSIVDLVNVERTMSFSLPISNCFGCVGRRNNLQITHRLWAMYESPVFGRIYFLNAKDGISAVLTADLTPVHQPQIGSLPSGSYTDLVQNPRNGDLVVLGIGNPETPVELLDPFTLLRIPRAAIVAGGIANDIELLP